MITFPQNFLWGAATSSYQVEGGNANSDWWHWEKKAGKENSAAACRHYELYEQDFDLAQSLSHNAHRLSIEWSRIEPEEGKFSQEELVHYIKVIDALRQRGLEPLVTLHHFTNPLWFVQKGGWQNRRSVEYFLRFSHYIVEALAEKVRYWITINEPLVYSYHAYILGVWPPQEKSLFKALQVEENFLSAHVKAYRLIHEIYRKANLSQPAVSIAQNVQAFVPCRPILKDKFAAFLRDRWYNFRFIKRLAKQQALDYIGLNYYSRQVAEVKNWGLDHLIMDTCSSNHHPVKRNSLGWDIYPQGLYELLLKFRKFNLPVIITENGICTDDDSLRWEYIAEHLKSIHAAMEKGALVSGYIYWSLMDNFEWDKGFTPHFGLIGIDYHTYERKIRPSAQKFASVCRTGTL
ncbi:MAG: glycoside hydrolase family 1 protein [Candidatus Omnitrophica bacterium]|jgi:beta-glucosidase|nr:glycoside hydrolase family 1 protein [Candidatus Omnitrophota bacterium]